MSMDRLTTNESSRTTASFRGPAQGTFVSGATAVYGGHALPRACDSTTTGDYIHRASRGGCALPAPQRRSAVALRRGAGSSQISRSARPDRDVSHFSVRHQGHCGADLEREPGCRDLQRSTDRSADGRHIDLVQELWHARQQIARTHSTRRSAADGPSRRFSTLFPDSSFRPEAGGRHRDRTRNPNATGSRNASAQFRHLHAKS